MTVLDTNVLSEMIKPSPEPAVVQWFGAQPGDRLYTTSITKAEILFGTELLPAGRRRRKLREGIDRLFDEVFRSRILPFDESAAQAYAEIFIHRRSLGQPIAPFDAMIAAIARVHGAALAARNTADFAHCGLRLINPWDRRPPLRTRR